MAERIRKVQQSIEHTEQLITLRLSLVRNRLVMFDVAVGTITVAIALGTCLTGIFGMNLHSGLEDDHQVFLTVVWLVVVTIVAALVALAGVLATVRL